MEVWLKLTRNIIYFTYFSLESPFQVRGLRLGVCCSSYIAVIFLGFNSFNERLESFDALWCFSDQQVNRIKSCSVALGDNGQGYSVSLSGETPTCSPAFCLYCTLLLSVLPLFISLFPLSQDVVESQSKSTTTITLLTLFVGVNVMLKQESVSPKLLPNP